MVLWQVTSYPTALDTEKRRLRALYRLRDHYGSEWDRRIPDDLAWMLRDGVLLDEALDQIAELAGGSPHPARPSIAACRRSDEELAADMCDHWPDTRPSREWVRTTYRIGSGRARRIRSRWTAAARLGLKRSDRSVLAPTAGQLGQTDGRGQPAALCPDHLVRAMSPALAGVKPQLP
jgi:hypothetical protein